MIFLFSYTVPKKEAKEFKRLVTNSEMGGMEAALQYLDKDVLPPHWDRDVLFGQEPQSDDVDSDDVSIYLKNEPVLTQSGQKFTLCQ